METLLLIGLPLAGAMLLFLGIFQVIEDFRSPEKKQIMDRLTGQKQEAKAKISKALVRPDIEEQVGGLTGFFARMGRTFDVSSLLEQANLDYEPGKFVGVMIGGALFVFLLCVVLGVGAIIGLVIALVVGSVPWLWATVRKRSRARKIGDQLPDVFELMGQALRAGHSLTSAIQLVSEELSDPAGTEFGRVFQEQNLGLPLEAAMSRMGERINNMDLHLFITAVLIQRQSGGDLAELLDNIGDVIRDRIRIIGMVRGLTAEGRLSGWALTALPLFVFCASAVMNPTYAGLLINTEKGRWMLGGAVFLQLLGILTIRKIVNIRI